MVFRPPSADCPASRRLVNLQRDNSPIPCLPEVPDHPPVDHDIGIRRQIDLSGIRLKQLPHRFRLSKTPAGTLNVSFIREGKSVSGPAWSYDRQNNELVFETAPDEGITIQVLFN